VDMVLTMYSTSSLSANASHTRTVLYDDIMTIWQDSGNEGSLDLTVSFLLVPYNNGKLTNQETHKIVSAVFRFIGRSSRCL